MSKSTTLIVLGVLIFLSPFIGLPTSWLSWLLPLFGIIVGVIGYLVRMRAKQETPEVVHEVAAAPVVPVAAVEPAPVPTATFDIPTPEPHAES